MSDELVPQGYWNCQAETEATFNAQIRGTTEGRGHHLSATATAQMVDQTIECSYKDQDCLALRVTNRAMRVTGYEVVQSERALLTVRNEGAADGVNIRRRSVDVIQPLHGSELEKDLAASILTEGMASSVGSGAVAIREGIWRWLSQPGLVHIGAGDSHLPAVSEAGNYLIAGDTSSIGITLGYQYLRRCSEPHYY